MSDNKHINNPSEYYGSYHPKPLDDSIKVEFKKDEPVINSSKILQNSALSLIELDIWKIENLGGVNRPGETILIDEKNWLKFSMDKSDNFCIIDSKRKLHISNLIKNIRKLDNNFENINISNILLVAYLDVEKYGIENYNVIRVILKADYMNSNEISFIEKENTICRELYNNLIDNNILDFSTKSSIIPKRPIYTLEYFFNEKLALSLSNSSSLDIYEKVNLIGNQFIKSCIKSVNIYTKYKVDVEIYFSTYDNKYELVKKDTSNKYIYLDDVNGEDYVKKNIIIKVHNFNNNNKIYLSQINY